MHGPVTLGIMLTFLLALHAGAIAAFALFFSWPWLVATLVSWQIFALIGISVCLHREVSHRAFRSTLVLRIFHLVCATIAGQAGPLLWASVHRAHHRHADSEQDLHSPKEGFWLAHLGWLFQQRRRHRHADLLTPAPDLAGDPLLRFFQRVHFPAQIAIFAGLYLWQGWPALCWLGCARVVLTLHSAWSINSLGHMVGYRNHDTPDLSRNCRMLALFTAGEGLHNNHHHTPRSANLAHRAGETDLGYLYIRAMQRLGLVSEISAPSRMAS